MGERRAARQLGGYEDGGMDAELLEELDAEVAPREEPLIEKILGKRKGADGDEYLVKWRHKSYLHVEWIKPGLVLEDINGQGRLKRFEQALETEGQPPQGEYFEPSFVEVERIVDATHEASAPLSLPSGAPVTEENKWMRAASQLLSHVINYRSRGRLLSTFFMAPVREEEDFAPGYYEKITKPMDFGTIREKLMSGKGYENVEQFAADVRQVFENCRLYNPNPELFVRFCGDRLSEVFERRYKSMLAGEDAEDADGGDTRKFLVKWKGLSYADMTWEAERDILDDSAIAAYYRRSVVPKRAAKGDEDNKPLPFVKYATSPKFKNGLSLRSYQLEGLNWLAFNHANKRGCILADEMGLGKTCQTVAFVNHLQKLGGPGAHHKPCLVVAPLSTLGHWKNEFERWSDLNVLLYHDQGNRRLTGAQTRALIRDTEFYYWNKKKKKAGVARPVPGVFKFQVLITSFEVLVADAAELAGVRFSAVIVDEGHRLKSKKGKLASTFRDYVRCEQRIILTGTPLQNNVGELFNLLNFVDPEGFRDKDQFEAEFGDMQNADQVRALQTRVKPYMLRRLKEHVEKDLPSKEETVIDVELTTMQKKYYRAIFERNREFLSGGVANAASRAAVPPQLSNIEMELRKCCNHPYLISGIEEIERKGAPGSAEALESVVQASGKMVLLDKLLDKLRKEGHKVLIFSQFKIMLDIIQDYCAHSARAYPVERIDGNVSGNDRQKAIDRYCDPRAKSFVFLLSTRAGGVGINLTAADTVIIFDSDWNPQNDLQAMARCHRIGQKKAVKIYRFVTKNTYEAHLFDRAARKLGLEQAVLGRQGTASANQAVQPPQTKEEIEELLRHGAYRLLENDDEAAKKAREYSEANIEDLLKHDSRKVNWDKGAGGEAAGGFSFSKASFVAAGTDQEIDVADPSFWTKMLGEDPRGTLMARLVDGTAVETPEDKRKFFDELRKVGNQVIQDKLGGNVKPEYEDQVTGCLVQITSMKRTFTSQEQAAATHFLKQVERPSRRHYAQAADVARFYDGEVLGVEGEGEADGDGSGTPSRGRRSKRGRFGGDDSGDDSEQGGGRGSAAGSQASSRKKKRTCVVDGREMDTSVLQNKFIEPEELRRIVDSLGGYENVVVERMWGKVRAELGLEPSNSISYSVHRVYKKYFFEDRSKVPNLDDEKKRRAAERAAKAQQEAQEAKAARAEQKAIRKRLSRSLARSPRIEPKIELFDPSVYTELTAKGEPWCRYCGATTTSGWSRSPWGPRRLCIVHYVEWHQKGTLDLSEYSTEEEPKQPINPHKNSQFKFLAFKKEKEERNRLIAEEGLGKDDAGEAKGASGDAEPQSGAAQADPAADGAEAAATTTPSRRAAKKKDRPLSRRAQRAARRAAQEDELVESLRQAADDDDEFVDNKGRACRRSSRRRRSAPSAPTGSRRSSRRASSRARYSDNNDDEDEEENENENENENDDSNNAEKMEVDQDDDDKTPVDGDDKSPVDGEDRTAATAATAEDKAPAADEGETDKTGDKGATGEADDKAEGKGATVKAEAEIAAKRERVDSEDREPAKRAKVENGKDAKTGAEVTAETAKTSNTEATGNDATASPSGTSGETADTGRVTPNGEHSKPSGQAEEAASEPDPKPQAPQAPPTST